MTVTLKPGAWVDPSAMTKAIHAAGFTPVPEEVFLKLAGTIAQRDGRFVLVLSAMKEPREVTLVPPEKDGAPAAAALREHDGAAVKVSGRWIFEEGGRLEVTAVERE